MAARLSVEPAKLLETLKATVFRGASNEELLALVVVANEYKLNPLLKELYAFPAKGGGIVPVVGVDGWTKIVNRQETFDGVDFEWAWNESDGKPISCTCIIGVKGRSKPVRVTEFLAECFRATEPWKNMPCRMLRHRAFIQAARIAFGLSGIVDEDEAGEIVDITPPSFVPAVKAPEPQPAPANGDSKTAQSQLAEFVTESGLTFTHLQRWGIDSGNIENADSIGSFDEIPAETCKRLLRAKSGLLKGLEAIKLQESA